MRRSRMGIGSYGLGDRYVSPDRRLSESLMKEGARKGPAYHWSDTLGRIAQQLAGGYLAGRDRNNQDVANRAFTGVEPTTLRQPTEEEAYKESPALRNLQALGQEKEIPGFDLLHELPPQPQPSDAFSQIPADPNDSYSKQQFEKDFPQEEGPIEEPPRVGPRDYAQELAQGMGAYRGNEDNRITKQKMPQSEYSMQELRKLTDNPYAQRLLQGLMMQSADRDYASGLAETQRGYKDAEYKRGRTDKDTDYNRKRKDDLADQDAKQKFEKEQAEFKRNNEGSSPFPFEGTTIPGQATNILLTRNPDTSSPIYHSAYAKIAKPQITIDSTGRRIIHTPDMRAYPKPTEINRSSTWNPYNKQEDLLTGKGKWEPVDYSKYGGIPDGKILGSERPSSMRLGESPNERSIGMPSISYTDGQGRTKFNDAENKASGFYSRMLSANKAMGGVLAGEDKMQGTPDDVKYDDVNSLGQSFKGAFPFFGNQWISNERQQLQQAQENWVSAVLRRESGAVLGDDEIVRENKKYFPQYGDSEETIAQKVLARKEAEAGMLQSSGGAWEAAQEKKGKNKRSTDKKRSTDIPEGVSKEQWGVMLPEQKALWK